MGNKILDALLIIGLAAVVSILLAVCAGIAYAVGYYLAFQLVLP